MGIFIIFRVTNPTLMSAAIKDKYPNDHLDISHNEWLISSKETAKEISDKLGVSTGTENNNAIVFGMSGYFGRAATDIWDWIKAKSEASDG